MDLMRESGVLGIKDYRRFLAVELVFGLLGLYMFSNLPTSESQNAIWMGLSLTRLFIFILFILCILVLLGALIFTFAQSDACQSKWGRMVSYLLKHDLLESCVYSISFLFFIAILFLELFIYQALLPGAQYYQFLYVRIRPLAIWSAAFSGHLFLFNRKHVWKKIQPRKSISASKRKNERISLACLLVAWFLMGMLWLLYIWLENSFVNLFYVNAILLLVSLILLLVPLWMANAANIKE